MKMITNIKRILDGEAKAIDIFYYLQGHCRYSLYYSKSFAWLIRKHIKEQIEYRVQVMNEECYNTGACIMCGCKTIELQMCNKPCEGKCYPKMMTRKEWKIFKQKHHINKHGNFKHTPQSL